MNNVNNGDNDVANDDGDHQIDQKSAVDLPTVPAYCLTITLNFLLY